jgi:predicted DNA-binding protein (MmcQ/YjbR family)
VQAAGIGTEKDIETLRFFANYAPFLEYSGTADILLHPSSKQGLFAMNIEQFREYCLSKAATSEDFPFGPDTLVLRVAGKIFAITGLDNERFAVNLKCDPDRATELREAHPEIQPGWHMNKKHWNTVDFEGALDPPLLRELIDHSYRLVVQSLKKSEREKFGV